MRNYGEVGMAVFIGEFAKEVENQTHTKRPGVKFIFFTRPQQVFKMLTRSRAAT